MCKCRCVILTEKFLKFFDKIELLGIIKILETARWERWKSAAAVLLHDSTVR